MARGVTGAPEDAVLASIRASITPEWLLAAMRDGETHHIGDLCRSLTGGVAASHTYNHTHRTMQRLLRDGIVEKDGTGYVWTPDLSSPEALEHYLAAG